MFVYDTTRTLGLLRITIRCNLIYFKPESLSVPTRYHACGDSFLPGCITARANIGILQFSHCDHIYRMPSSTTMHCNILTCPKLSFCTIGLPPIYAESQKWALKTLQVSKLEGVSLYGLLIVNYDMVKSY